VPPDAEAFDPVPLLHALAEGVRITLSRTEVLVASLDHLIAMKEAAGQPKDKLMATEYRVLSDELRAPRPPSAGHEPQA